MAIWERIFQAEARLRGKNGKSGSSPGVLSLPLSTPALASLNQRGKARKIGG